MIIIMLVISYITHSYYILYYYIITQDGYSPLDWARICGRHIVVKILEKEEKKLRK